MIERVGNYFISKFKIHELSKIAISLNHLEDSQLITNVDRIGTTLNVFKNVDTSIIENGTNMINNSLVIFNAFKEPSVQIIAFIVRTYFRGSGKAKEGDAIFNMLQQTKENIQARDIFNVVLYLSFIIAEDILHDEGMKHLMNDIDPKDKMMFLDYVKKTIPESNKTAMISSSFDDSLEKLRNSLVDQQDHNQIRQNFDEMLQSFSIMNQSISKQQEDDMINILIQSHSVLSKNQ